MSHIALVPGDALIQPSVPTQRWRVWDVQQPCGTQARRRPAIRDPFPRHLPLYIDRAGESRAIQEDSAKAEPLWCGIAARQSKRNARCDPTPALPAGVRQRTITSTPLHRFPVALARCAFGKNPKFFSPVFQGNSRIALRCAARFSSFCATPRYIWMGCFHPLPRASGKGLLFHIRIAALPALMQAHPAHLLYLLQLFYKYAHAAVPAPLTPPASGASFRHPSMSLGSSFPTFPARFRHERGTVWAWFFISSLRSILPSPKAIPFHRWHLRSAPHPAHLPIHHSPFPPLPTARADKLPAAHKTACQSYASGASPFGRLFQRRWTHQYWPGSSLMKS